MKYYAILLISVLTSCALLKGDKSASDAIIFDLSELDANDQKKLESSLEIQKLDVKTGQVSITKKAFESTVEYFMERAVLNPEIESLDFYLPQSRPRLRYWEHIISQLPDFVNYGYKYDSYTGTKKDKDKFLAYLVYRIDRNPQNILKTWEKAKGIFFALVNKEQYVNYQFDDYVETLLLAHDHITTLPEYNGLMNEIYSQVEQEDEIEEIFGRTSNQFSIYEAILSPDILNKYRGSNGMALNDFGEFTDVLWFHSFWVRRYREANTEAVYKILKELEAHYKI